MGRGKNALKILYVHKALSTIDAELQLINLKINHPEQFKLSIPTAFKSDLYVIPKSKDLGIIGIAEIVLALFLQGQIVGEDGKPVPEVRLARGFEQLFNLKFGSIYDKVGEVLYPNCTTASKSFVIFHFICSLILSAETFSLLSPPNSASQLGDFQFPQA